MEVQFLCTGLVTSVVQKIEIETQQQVGAAFFLPLCQFANLGMDVVIQRMGLGKATHHVVGKVIGIFMHGRRGVFRGGGQLIAASAPSFKTRLSMLVAYYETQMKKLGVNVLFNREVNADTPELAEADKIIVAVGGHGFVPPIKGVDKPHVLEVIDAHTGDQSRIGQKVVIAGGGPSGCDCAIELAMEGKEVTIVEMVDKLYPTGTLDNRTSVLRRVKEENIHVMTGTKVLEFTDTGIAVENGDGQQELTADTCIIAMGTRPNADAAKAIMDKYVNAQMIGDCKKIGQVGEAVQAAYLSAWAID